MTEENSAARSAFASTSSRASRTSPSRAARSIASAVCAASVFRRPSSGGENGSSLAARTTVSAPNEPDRVTSGIEIVCPATGPGLPASALPTPTGVEISQLTSPKKSEERLRQPVEDAPNGSLEMNRSVVRLRKMRFGCPPLRSRPLLANPADEGADDEPGEEEREERDDVGRLSHRKRVVRLGEEEVEAEERQERGDDPAAPAGDRAGGDHRQEAERRGGGEILRTETEREPHGCRRCEDPDREDERRARRVEMRGPSSCL